MVLLIALIGFFLDSLCSIEVLAQRRILNGQLASDGQFPYLGYIIYGGGFACGATLIRSRWVLTAGHCIKPFPDGVVRFGTNNLYGSGGQTYGIETTIVHENYGLNVREGDKYGTRSDIALLRTDREVQFNNKVQPVQLATSEPSPNTLSILAGWGWTSLGSGPSPYLRYGQVHTMNSNDECRIAAPIWIVEDSQVCTTSQRTLSHGCYGDSGGPLMINGVQHGITSMGDPECSSTYPTVFTKVSAYMSWIQAKLQSYDPSDTGPPGHVVPPGDGGYIPQKPTEPGYLPENPPGGNYPPSEPGYLPGNPSGGIYPPPDPGYIPENPPGGIYPPPDPGLHQSQTGPHYDDSLNTAPLIFT